MRWAPFFVESVGSIVLEGVKRKFLISDLRTCPDAAAPGGYGDRYLLVLLLER